jgi:NMD protein affecting ribosome stability and mRNA decay
MRTKSYGKCKQCGRSESGGVKVILTNGLCGPCFCLAMRPKFVIVVEKK